MPGRDEENQVLRVKMQPRLVNTRIPLKLIELLQTMLKSVPQW